MKGMHCSAGNVKLVPIVNTTVAATLLRLNDGKATKRFAFFNDPVDLEREEKYLQSKIDSTNDLLWTVYADEKLIGTAGLHEIDFNLKTGRLGVLLWSEEFHGQGYGSDVVRALLAYLFDILELQKAYLAVRTDNVRAQELYRRLGFKDECVLKGEYLLGEQRFDMLRMHMFKDGWSDNSSPSSQGLPCR